LRKLELHASRRSERLMTDVILEDKQGKRLHYFIDDNRSATVCVLKDGTVTVKPISRDIESKLDRLLKVLTQE